MTDDTVIRSPKIAARRRAVSQQRRRKRRRMTVAATTAIGIAAGAFVLTGSAVFGVASVDVRGASRTDPAEIIAASGLQVGGNALSADLERAVERVEALPAIRRATVSRIDGVGVVIAVVERVPAVEIVGPEQRWIVDRDGVVLADVTDAEGVPVVRAPWAVDAQVPLLPTDAAAIATIWDRAGRLGGATGGVVRADLTFRAIIGGAKVEFGALESVPDKMRSLGLIRQRLKRSGDRLLAANLASPDRPAVVIAG